jgi:alkylation response protein AidB-like acyl-CoA dehydrogenase
MYTCDELWCQLFSEPGAGSDLAGLATSAVLDGDEWVVSGQKVWTSLAHLARWGMLLARTDPGVPKHQGLTFFVLDMTAPGVTVRPLRQMTGESEFNEVFLDRVRVPDTQRVGPIGAGWKVAMTTLSNERNAIGQIGDARGSGLIGVALRLWDRRPELRTPVFEHRLTELLVRSEAARFTSMRRRATRASVAAGAADKLVWAELGQAIFNFCVDLLGPEAARYEDYSRERAAADLGDGVRRRVGSDPDDDDIMRMALRSRAYTIEGGTSDVLRNVIAERILGLPPDLRNDLGRPWNEVRRG